MTYEERHAIEERIVRQVITETLAAGYTISVHDGDTFTLEQCADVETIVRAMFTADEDYLHVYRPGQPESLIAGVRSAGNLMGWVRFVYGNDGWDVICDSCGPIEPLLARAEELAELLSEKVVA